MKRTERNKSKQSPTEQLQNRPHTDPNDDGGKKENTNRHVYIEPGVQIDLVQNLKKTYETSQTDSTTHNRKQLFWTKVAAGLLVVTAGFTGFQAYYSRKSAVTAVNSFRAAQQALVIFKTISHDAIIENYGRFYEFSAIFENVGGTPATDIYEHFHVQYLPHPPTKEQFRGEYRFIAGNLSPRIATTLFVRKQNSFIDIRNLPDLREYEEGDPEEPSGYYFWGWMAYKDIFPDSKVHITEFCQKLIAIRARDKQEWWKMENCREHNCSDTSCGDDSFEVMKLPPKF